MFKNGSLVTAYYNEIDPYAAQWLRNLIAAGLIAFAMLIVIFSAYGICSDDYDYAAPTLHDICAGKNWPIDEDAKLAYERACKSEFVSPS
jgi:hypothetical protein